VSFSFFFSILPDADLHRISILLLMGLSGLKDPGQKPKFTQRFLDADRLTYQFHAGDKFDTAEGIQTTHKLTAAAKELNIHCRLGVAPQ
jgi:hypothetical protein